MCASFLAGLSQEPIISSRCRMREMIFDRLPIPRRSCRRSRQASRPSGGKHRTRAYSSATFDLKKSWSSALIVTRTPASSICGSGRALILGTAFRRTFEVGHTSQATPSAAKRSSKLGSSTALMP